ncbi:MAG: transglutaminase-like domain-containing protein [Anaerolineales bacterium]
MALIRDLSPYQEVISRSISPSGYVLSKDEYGNEYAEFDLSEHAPGTTISIEIDYQVSVNELTYDLSNCEGETPDEFTQPELHIESANPQIVSLAEELSKGKSTACEQVRAFYDYAGDELIYTYNRTAWGAQATFGLMGADCTEYASLVAALSRAEGIPARYYEGLLYLEETSADKDKAIAQTEHAWLDVYLPGIGWTALDPTMGRGAVNRETYFAHYTPDHIIVTTGRNPSTLRGASYWSHLYWPGNLTNISVSEASWDIQPVQ